ncbi:MAG: pol protein, partial [Massilia sp.]|nr:pol protein [Massilia sp.]
MTPEESERMRSVPTEYWRYDKLFEERTGEDALPEHTRWDHEIPLEPGTQPRFHKVYPLNELQRRELKEYVQKALRKGHIRPSTSPAGHPILFVPKKNGELRMCVDYRSLNDITIKNRYPLPLITEIRDKLYGAQWFTALDLTGAYNLIRIKEGEEWKTAFRTQEGHFEYLVMPFGLTNAPATFQSMINHVLREFLDQFVMVYLDDILIFSRTLEEHKEHVHQVLQRLQDAKLLVEPKKSKFHTQQVEYLGLTIEPGRVRMQDSKIEAVKDWPRPQNVKDVRGFLGFTNYYRRFIKNYSKIASPLTDLTKGKGSDIQWNDKTEQAFQRIKEAILEEPILAMPDPDREFEVETDASDFAIGGQLGQRDSEGRLHPIAFFSKKLNGPELNYQIHDKELMAIIEAFKEWKPHLSGTTHQVKVYTDHKNLTYFTTTKELNKRQTRWAEFLSEFNFRIIYRKGSENGRADALSRRTDHEQDQAPEHQTILRVNQNGDLEQDQRGISAMYKMQPDLKWESAIQDLDPTQDLTRHNGRIVVPESIIKDLIKDYHEHPLHGHLGITKTTEKVSRTYHFPGIRRRVQEVIHNCQPCQQNKASRHKPYGELRPLPIADRAWGSIAFDHIVKLPPSKEPMTNTVYDSVFVITDRLTKYGYFIPYKEASLAEDLAYTFLRIVASNHGLPDEIISDRGTTLASHFWQSLMSQLGVKHKLSTAYHPQTDGQTERLNQTLEQYLRSY